MEPRSRGDANSSSARPRGRLLFGLLVVAGLLLTSGSVGLVSGSASPLAPSPKAVWTPPYASLKGFYGSSNYSEGCAHPSNVSIPSFNSLTGYARESAGAWVHNACRPSNESLEQTDAGGSLQFAVNSSWGPSKFVARVVLNTTAKWALVPGVCSAAPGYSGSGQCHEFALFQNVVYMELVDSAKPQAKVSNEWISDMYGPLSDVHDDGTSCTTAGSCYGWNSMIQSGSGATLSAFDLSIHAATKAGHSYSLEIDWTSVAYVCLQTVDAQLQGGFAGAWGTLTLQLLSVQVR